MPRQDHGLQNFRCDDLGHARGQGETYSDPFLMASSGIWDELPADEVKDAVLEVDFAVVQKLARDYTRLDESRRLDRVAHGDCAAPGRSRRPDDHHMTVRNRTQAVVANLIFRVAEQLVAASRHLFVRSNNQSSYHGMNGRTG